MLVVTTTACLDTFGWGAPDDETGPLPVGTSTTPTEAPTTATGAAGSSSDSAGSDGSTGTTGSGDTMTDAETSTGTPQPGCEAPGWDPLIQEGQAGDEVHLMSWATAMDSAGNLVAAGRRGSKVFSPGFEGSAHVMKFNDAGTLLWERTFSGVTPGNSEIKDLVIDTMGEIYVVGGFIGEFAPDPLDTWHSFNGKSDYFVAKLTPGGVTVWAAREELDYIDAGDDLLFGVTIGHGGSIAAVGTCLGGGLFTAIYAEDGTQPVLHCYKSGASSSLQDIKPLSSGRFFASGAHRGATQFGGFALMDLAQDKDGLIVVLEPDGSPSPDFSPIVISGLSYDSVRLIHPIEDTGELVIGGRCSSSTNWACDPCTADNPAYVARLNALGGCEKVVLLPEMENTISISVLPLTEGEPIRVLVTGSDPDSPFDPLGMTGIAMLVDVTAGKVEKDWLVTGNTSIITNALILDVNRVRWTGIVMGENKWDGFLSLGPTGKAAGFFALDECFVD